MGLIIFPIGLWFYLLFKNTNERRKVKRLLRDNKFLIPIDKKDYDYKSWENKKYGNINPSDYENDLNNLNLKIFKKIKIQEENPFEDKKANYSDEFLKKALGYLKKAKEQGYEDEYIKIEFQKKNYPEDLINKIFENGR